jgi:tRNA(Arg) A34 adenosine deaminase TadA
MLANVLDQKASMAAKMCKRAEHAEVAARKAAADARRSGAYVRWGCTVCIRLNP